MKAIVTIKLKYGYLIISREVESLTIEEIFSASLVTDGDYSHRDKVGRVAIELLEDELEEKEETE